jgi:hypothetical protein
MKYAVTYIGHKQASCDPEIKNKNISSKSRATRILPVMEFTALE